MRAFFLIAALALVPVGASAQSADPGALAEIRQELTALNAEIQALRRELDVQPNAIDQVSIADGPTVLRLDRIEAEIRELTGNVEQLGFRISRVAEDGTRRIQDLEFRLVELEGGDVSQISDTSLLGGEVQTAVSVTTLTDTDTAAPELAVAEKSDFERALSALKDGQTSDAIFGFRQFLTNYPGGPLTAEAMYHLGDAETQEGQHKLAARAFLDSFTASPGGPYAAKSLMRVGVALNQLGQIPEACQTLQEVLARFPADPVVPEAQSNISAIGCS